MNVDALRLIAELPFSGEIVGPSDGDYDAARRVWNGIADRRPAVIARARTRADVAAIVRFAADTGALLAVRGGGHSLPGLSTCDGGIVLDLSMLNDVVIDPDRMIATVGGGALLRDLDAAASAHDLVVPAGVISHTGVAGLTLGGGMGWLSRRFGLTIDSLAGVDVVLADGREIRVDADEEPELFWGLRGGGGNFGVATSFRFRVHRLGPVVVAKVRYRLDEARAVLERYRDLVLDAPREIGSAFTVSKEGVSMTVVSSGRDDGRDRVAAFARLGKPIEISIGGHSFIELQSGSDDAFRWGRRYYAKGGFLAAIDDSAVEAVLDAVAAAPTSDAEIYVLQLGGAVADVSDAATAYTGRTAGAYWIVEPVWDDPADDVRCLAWGRATAARLVERSLTGNYVNEQGDTGDSVARDAYGSDTYARLLALKRRFDPANVFRLNQNIDPGGPVRTDAVGSTAADQVGSLGLSS